MTSDFAEVEKMRMAKSMKVLFIDTLKLIKDQAGGLRDIHIN